MESISTRSTRSTSSSKSTLVLQDVELMICNEDILFTQEDLFCSHLSKISIGADGTSDDTFDRTTVIDHFIEDSFCVIILQNKAGLKVKSYLIDREDFMSIINHRTSFECHKVEESEEITKIYGRFITS